jgi:hypothetical protein
MRKGDQSALCIVTLLLGMLCGMLPRDTDAISQEEVNRIAFDAQRRFEHIVQLWKDEEFAALYDLGTFASQVDISPEGFARYMEFATRSLQCCWRTIQAIESIVDTPDKVYIKARLGFKNKEFLVLRGQHRFLARGFAEDETLTFSHPGTQRRPRRDPRLSASVLPTALLRSLAHVLGLVAQTTQLKGNVILHVEIVFWHSRGRAHRRLAVVIAQGTRQKLHSIGNHLMFTPLLPILGFPAPPLQTAFYHRQVAFGEIFCDGLGLATEAHNVHIADLVPPRVILAKAPVDSQTKR